MARQEVAVDPARLFVRQPVLGAQLDDQADGLVRRQVVARQIDDVLAVDHRPAQLGQIGVAAVGALGRGGQPQAEGGHRRARRQRVGRPGQVMALVEHQQAEAVAQVLHVQVGRVVRRDGQRLDRVFAAADEADRHAEAGPKHVVPLADQVQRRRQHQRAAAAIVDGQAGDVGLAGAGGQHDDAPPLGRPPGGQRLAPGRGAASAERAGRRAARRTGGPDPRPRARPAPAPGGRSRSWPPARGSRPCGCPRRTPAGTAAPAGSPASSSVPPRNASVNGAAVGEASSAMSHS